MQQNNQIGFNPREQIKKFVYGYIPQKKVTTFLDRIQEIYCFMLNPYYSFRYAPLRKKYRKRSPNYIFLN